MVKIHSSNGLAHAVSQISVSPGWVPITCHPKPGWHFPRLALLHSLPLGKLAFFRALLRVYLIFQVWEGRWRVIPYDVLPDWLKDNDYLLHGHRPPMPSFRACFKSIFRIHTETGNIWTHLLGEWFGKKPNFSVSLNAKGLCPLSMGRKRAKLFWLID